MTDLAERRRRIDDHGRMLRERMREIAEQRSERSAELRLLEGVDAFCTSIREAMKEPSFTIQQKVLQLVVNRIVVGDNQVVIEHVVPSGPVRLQTEQHLYRNLRFGNNALSSNRLGCEKSESQNNPRFSYGSLRRPFWAENRPKNPFRKSKSGSWANGEFSCTAKP